MVNLSLFFILVMVYNHTLREKVECYWMERAVFGGKEGRRRYRRVGERDEGEDG